MYTPGPVSIYYVKSGRMAAPSFYRRWPNHSKARHTQWHRQSVQLSLLTRQYGRSQSQRFCHSQSAMLPEPAHILYVHFSNEAKHRTDYIYYMMLVFFSRDARNCISFFYEIYIRAVCVCVVFVPFTFRLLALFRFLWHGIECQGNRSTRNSNSCSG